ncbi:unnamed protein product [Effrenium voratum]|nr:unnamed protein product [Effrenium voratum]
MAMMRTRYVPLPSRGRIGAARAAEHGLCSRSSWAEGQHIGKTAPVACRSRSARRGCARGQQWPGPARSRGGGGPEFVEEDLLLARQQLQFALAQQETAQAQVKTAHALAEESGDAKKVQAAERKVERAKKEVQEAKKEVQEAKKEDSLGPQVTR